MLPAAELLVKPVLSLLLAGEHHSIAAQALPVLYPTCLHPLLLLHPTCCLQAFLALSSSPTAYSGQPGSGMTDAKLAGANLGLVALVQMRNNARVAVAGSIDMFTDAFASADATSRSGGRCAVWAAHAGCLACTGWGKMGRGGIAVGYVLEVLGKLVLEQDLKAGHRLHLHLHEPWHQAT